MGQDTSQIEREIRSEREELGRNLEDLEQKAKALADWRVHYANHPEVFLGAAVGVGLLLGVLTSGDSTERSAEAYPRSSEAYPRERLPLRERSRKAAQVIDTWGHVSDALLGLATAKAIDVISEFLPGFRDQYERHDRTGPHREVAI